MSKERELLRQAANALDPFDNRVLLATIDNFLAEPDQEPEPVAWMQISVSDDFCVGARIPRRDHPKEYNPEWWKFEPLYTTPPDAAKKIAELEKEIVRLEQCLKVSNSGFEEYERKYYLEQMKAEDLESRINNGVRVYAWLDDGVVRMDDSLNNHKHCTATLILDEQGEE
jgi:hypothetical protein